MEVKRIEYKNLSCLCAKNPKADRVAYMILPLKGLDDWIGDAANRYGVSFVIITGTDWENDLTPWPAAGVPKGHPDFKGNAPEFFNELTQRVIPFVEKELGMSENIERDLIGVSLSGLFTLWQWAKSDYFKSIATSSGSFWYEGFTNWLCQQSFAGKTGKCYMLLGSEEPKSPDPTYRTVGEDTRLVVDHLRSQGVDITYETVPGNHFQYGVQRIERACAHLFLS